MKMFDWFKKLNLEKEMQKTMLQIEADSQAGLERAQQQMDPYDAISNRYVAALSQSMQNNLVNSGAQIVGTNSIFANNANLQASVEHYLRQQVRELESVLDKIERKNREVNARATQMAHYLLIKINSGLNPEQIEAAMQLIAEQMDLTGERYDQ